MATKKAVKVEAYEEEVSLRVHAMESLLTEKGIIDTEGVDEIVEFFQTKIGPQKRCQGRRQGLDRPRIQEVVA